MKNLIEAIKINDEKMVEELLKNSELQKEINQQNRQGETVLHLAFKRRHSNKNIQKLLLSAGASPMIEDHSGNSFFDHLVLDFQFGMVESLLSNPFLVKTQNEIARFIMNASVGDVKRLQAGLEMVSKHLAHSRLAKNGIIVALLIANKRKQVDSVKVLLPIKVVQEYVNRRLIKYTGKKTLETMISLLDLGGDPTHRDKENPRSALEKAIQEGSAEIVKYFFSFDFVRKKINVPDDVTGQTLLAMACETGNLEVVKLLLDQGADPNMTGLDTDTGKLSMYPLLVAAKKGHIDIIKQLLDHKADPLLRDDDEATVLMLAADRGQAETVKFLLSQKIFQRNISNVDNHGDTALTRSICAIARNRTHHTSSKLSILTVHHLLEMGATSLIDFPNMYGDTPMQLANSFGLFEIKKLLQEYAKDSKEKNVEATLFLNRIALLKQVGHVMGLNGATFIENPILGVNSGVDYGLESPFNSIQWINEITNHYVSKLSKDTFTDKEQTTKNTKAMRYFKLISEAFKAEEEYIKLDKTRFESAENLVKRYYEGKITIIPVSWKRHDITVTLYKNYVIVCNRGEGMQKEGGTTIYKIKPDLKISAQFIENLNPVGFRRPMEAIMPIVNSILETDESNQPRIVTTLSSQGQKHGTCSFVNQKSAVEGILYLLDREENQIDKVKDEKIKFKLEEDSRLEALKLYKSYTKAMRDGEVDKLISEWRGIFKTGSKVDIDLYLKIFTDIIAQHFGQSLGTRTEKRPAELERARIILSALDPNNRKIVLDCLEKLNSIPEKLFVSAFETNNKDLVCLLLDNRNYDRNFLGAVLKSGQKRNDLLAKMLATEPKNEKEEFQKKELLVKYEPTLKKMDDLKSKKSPRTHRPKT